MSAARVNCGTSSSPPAVLRQTQVHLTRLIGEDPVVEQTLHQPDRGGLLVLRLNADQDQQATADRSHRLAANLDLSR